MREIKFRAWDSENKKMDTPAILMCRYYDHVYRCICDDNESLILMQYTGLTDRNGEEIYEGDLIKCKRIDVNIVASVVFSPERAIFGLSLMGVAPFSEFKNLEIIGNIYEDPELLK